MVSLRSWMMLIVTSEYFGILYSSVLSCFLYSVRLKCCFRGFFLELIGFDSLFLRNFFGFREFIIVWLKLIGVTTSFILNSRNTWYWSRLINCLRLLVSAILNLSDCGSWLLVCSKLGTLLSCFGTGTIFLWGVVLIVLLKSTLFLWHLIPFLFSNFDIAVNIIWCRLWFCLLNHLRTCFFHNWVLWLLRRNVHFLA